MFKLTLSAYFSATSTFLEKVLELPFAPAPGTVLLMPLADNKDDGLDVTLKDVWYDLGEKAFRAVETVADPGMRKIYLRAGYVPEPSQRRVHQHPPRFSA